MLKTVKGIMKPDGKIDLDNFELPRFPVRVMVTILDKDVLYDEKLREIGDYLAKLEDYEDQLSQGLIQWK
ncbi:MAG: hypothetical protein A2W17_03915 [Planctomycetes bacterium RBG_16_41_13]|nr:MAG: hypothetical protein A2W17_03915 [Planctomycetes bacterium RBG_16_41_13]